MRGGNAALAGGLFVALLSLALEAVVRSAQDPLLRAALDNAGHASAALALVWCAGRCSRAELALAFATGSLMDVDHFLVAASVRLPAAHTHTRITMTARRCSAPAKHAGASITLSNATSLGGVR